MKFNNESDIIPMIVGLGNPPEIYANTYHNVGADILLEWLNNTTLKPKSVIRISESLWKVIIKKRTIFVLLAPDVMNRCGTIIYKAYKKLKCNRLIVAVDDLDTPAYMLRYQYREGINGTGGHNGVRNIVKAFPGQCRFHKILIGIGRPRHISVATHVLSEVSESYFYHLHNTMIKSLDMQIHLILDGMNLK